jgi:hypothetical protein
LGIGEGKKMIMFRSLFFSSIFSLLISLFLEITLFNYTHYATLFTSKQFGIVYSEQEQGFISNVNEYLLNKISVQDSFLLPAPLSSLKFKNLNTEIASIYIEPVFLRGNKQSIRVTWADEESSERFIDVSIIKGLNFSNYININPHGKVSNLAVEFLENNIAIKSIELNKEIPMAIMPIRLVIVFAISFLLLCLKNMEIRRKISWFCFDYLYDKTSRWQRIGFATLICSMLIFNFLVSYSVYEFRDNEKSAEWIKMYSHHMTNALLKKQLHLDIEVPKILSEIEKPYDDKYRRQYGLFINWNTKSLDTLENTLLGDRVYYKGKYYSYFGMVPVVILFAPYKLITGNYLPSSMGALLFASIATILLMLLWKQITQSYFKKCSYFFFLIGGGALYACSLIPIILVENRFHIIAQFSALAFVILGTIMLLQAKEKLSIKLLTISSLSFCLAVACRPSALFWSLLVPVLLWDKIASRGRHAGLPLLAIIIPFAIVGSILAWYNYARFDSPFEFGISYMISNVNLTALDKINLIGKIHYATRMCLLTLFNPPDLDITFPFVHTKVSHFKLGEISSFRHTEVVIGIFCFPIMWFLFGLKKNYILKKFIFAGIFISLFSVLVPASMGAYAWRYTMDFSWIMAIAALICIFQLQEKKLAMRKVILKTFYLCCIFTLLLAFFSTISYIIHYGFSTGNPLDAKIQHYLARTFGTICNVP